MTITLRSNLYAHNTQLGNIKVVGNSASLDIGGQVTETGIISVGGLGTNLAMDIYGGSTFTLAPAAGLAVTAGAYLGIASSGTFVNNGLITVANADLNIGGNDLGTGTINVQAGGFLHLSGSTGSTGTPTEHQPWGNVETINITSGMLQIDHPLSFMAAVNLTEGSTAYMDLKNTSISYLEVASPMGHSVLDGFNAAGNETAAIHLGTTLSTGDPSFVVHMSGNDAIITHSGPGATYAYTPFVYPKL